MDRSTTDVVELRLSYAVRGFGGLSFQAPIGSLRRCYKFHFTMPDLLDPVIAATSRRSMGFGSPRTQFLPAHLHRSEGRPHPPVGCILSQQLPDQGGDLARGGHGGHVDAFPVLDPQEECPQQSGRMSDRPARLDQYGSGECTPLIGDAAVDGELTAGLADTGREPEVAREPVGCGKQEILRWRR